MSIQGFLEHYQIVEPAATTSRRTPDPGKICVNESCRTRFFRRAKETLADYKRRTACCISCGITHRRRQDKKQQNEKDYHGFSEATFSCINCSWKHEDSDFGKHCGPCTTGQNFKMKEA